jgi:uncharacterized protein with LGFP repeats
VTRMLLRLVTATALAVAATLAPASVASPIGTAQAADLSYFDAGNIISDAVFYDAHSMDAAAVQAFLAVKGATCVAGEMPCLKDYAQDTADQPGDALCNGYAGTTAAAVETAASIITKAGASCGINPRVLLVLLQKEQGLVTGSKRTARAYTKATGFSCPDTAACNPAFSGFASQVYFAARQFQNYRTNPTRWSFTKRVGQTVPISYYPPYDYVSGVYYGNQDNRRCGQASVHLTNIATASLYTYTPYVPDKAALAAGYAAAPGAPDVTCSAYGNRNFWNYFTDWFGSTQSSGGSAIYTAYQSLGGETGPLGAPTSSFLCGLTKNGCWQGFAHGRIYWTPTTGAHAVTGDVLTRWTAAGAERSNLGYPLTDSLGGLPGGGSYQIFATGTFYDSPASGLHLVRDGMRTAWQKLGSESGKLGYPVTDEMCGLRSGGCWQAFAGGRMYWTAATGAREVSGDQLTSWLKLGSENGTLGYPLTNAICGLIRSGCYQLFERGSQYSTPTTGTQFIRGAVLTGWKARGAEWGALGYPTGGEQCGMPGGACYQDFENGRLTWSAKTDADSMTWPMAKAWDALGAGGGTLGHPLSDTLCGLARSGCYQLFQQGSLYSTPTTGTHFVRGAIRDAWLSTGLEFGVLGYPTTDERCGLSGGACVQEFEHGHIYWTAGTGAHPLRGPLLDAWLAKRATTPAIGYPTGAQRSTATGAEQSFAGGTLVHKSSDGSVTFVAK